jgi:hypothetical protein
MVQVVRAGPLESHAWGDDGAGAEEEGEELYAVCVGVWRVCLCRARGVPEDAIIPLGGGEGCVSRCEGRGGGAGVSGGWSFEQSGDGGWDDDEGVFVFRDYLARIFLV